ncbi:type IV toxin-antitoxin system AbiEi family antitoxin domain-containing protein [Verrucomicrobiaceae bacterium 5K15]|uniref:Type IV toxin-antitoxin system AbiEi family antitoxin domain-containing protein n=1 Tax=Oceaniferula flava TaxID=2800421 RepID=A0AAE2VEM8_9BACT|nr:AbiEi antitoxin N-terminal domain-containing protein [Oceaniferula flavus]MBK1856034.1 type IV toxin-antitoxin system AbiEi family antitoxin domain-containing protein [Oceaniferula flavus]MBM1137341.1 type IV toxin-antitoxin system AbiEi family antitoxin domain-containing protein [Oceaniferula flavus]
MEIQRSQLEQLARESCLLRDQQLREAGISSTVISQAVKAGELIRLSRGVYHHPEAELDEHLSLSEVAARVPHAVITLLSALQFHQIGTQQPHAVWILLKQNAVTPRIDYPPLEVVRSKVASAFSKGVVSHNINDIPTLITNPARTVADCFKYRSRVGLDVCLEALKDVLNKGVKPAEIMDYAKAQRVSSVIRPYLDALV